jgi:hypothetical protein
MSSSKGATQCKDHIKNNNNGFFKKNEKIRNVTKIKKSKNYLTLTHICMLWNNQNICW